MAHEICMMNPILPAAFLDFDTPYNPGSITEIVEGDWKGCLRDQHGMVWASSGPSSFYYKPGWIESKRRAIVKFSISISSPENKIEAAPQPPLSPSRRMCNIICANECAEKHTCTECHKKGCFCDGIEKCDRCGWAACKECDSEGKQIDEEWVCGSCVLEEESDLVAEK